MVRVAMPSSLAASRLSPRVWRSVSWMTRISISASGVPIGNVSAVAGDRRAARRVADLARQGVLVDRRVDAGQHDRALDRVLELADVARPGVVDEPVERAPACSR